MRQSSDQNIQKQINSHDDIFIKMHSLHEKVKIIKKEYTKSLWVLKALFWKKNIWIVNKIHRTKPSRKDTKYIKTNSNFLK